MTTFSTTNPVYNLEVSVYQGSMYSNPYVPFGNLVVPATDSGVTDEVMIHIAQAIKNAPWASGLIPVVSVTKTIATTTGDTADLDAGTFG